MSKHNQNSAAVSMSQRIPQRQGGPARATARVLVEPSPSIAPPEEGLESHIAADDSDEESGAQLPSTAPGTDLPEVDEEFEFESAIEPVVAELGETIKPPAMPTRREIEEGGGDSMLARYFREMATHAVMGQEEELSTAVEVEDAEIAHWVALLAHLPAAEYILDSIERDLPTGEDAIDVPAIAELRDRKSVV